MPCDVRSTIGWFRLQWPPRSRSVAWAAPQGDAKRGYPKKRARNVPARSRSSAARFRRIKTLTASCDRRVRGASSRRRRRSKKSSPATRAWEASRALFPKTPKRPSGWEMCSPNCKRSAPSTQPPKNACSQTCGRPILRSGRKPSLMRERPSSTSAKRGMRQLLRNRQRLRNSLHPRYRAQRAPH